MMNIYVKDVLDRCQGKLLMGDIDLVLNDFSKDTRSIVKGDTYIGIKGSSYDGNKFYDEAFQKGAICCILENIDELSDISKYEGKTIILVSDTVKCLQEMARYKRSLYDIPVIAITGSVGKTSTKDIVYEVVRKKYKTLKTEGNENNHLGVPLTILRLKDHEALVIEMGMNHLGEISFLTEIAKPSIAVITNVGTAHIGNLGSRENILRAKLEITEGLENEGTLIINNDNDLLHSVCKELRNKYNVVTIGIDNDSDYNASLIEDNVFYSNFMINGNYFTINVGSDAFIYNSLIAYAIGKLLEIDNSSIGDALVNFSLSPHRLERLVTKSGITIIDDTYNANGDSMLNSLAILSRVKNKRRVAVLGDILELGDYAKEIHKKIGKAITPATLDILVTIGSYTKYLRDEVIRNGFDDSNIYCFDNVDMAISAIMDILDRDDIVLLKGSHGMNLIKMVDYLRDK